MRTSETRTYTKKSVHREIPFFHYGAVVQHLQPLMQPMILTERIDPHVYYGPMDTYAPVQCKRSARRCNVG